MTTRFLLTATMIAISLIALPGISVADSHMDYEWTIGVDGKSTSAGKIVFKVTHAPNPDESVDDPVEIEIMVADKTKHKDIQGTIENNFRATLGDERYKIRTHGSERVSIKANDKTPWFNLELTNNTVQGISLEIHR